MPFTQTINYGVTAGGTTRTVTITKTAGQEINLSETIPALASDLAIALAFDKDKLESVVIEATTTMTLETNSASVPGDSIIVAANTPLVWQKNLHHENPFSEDVTGLFVTSTDGGTLTINLLIDPT